MEQVLCLLLEVWLNSMVAIEFTREIEWYSFAFDVGFIYEFLNIFNRIWLQANLALIFHSISFSNYEAVSISIIT